MSDLGHLSVEERLADPAELTDVEKVLRVLLDRRWHTTSELFELTGGVTVHSRVSDLRARGHVIQRRRVPGGTRGAANEYLLLATVTEREAADGSLEESPVDWPQGTGDSSSEASAVASLENVVSLLKAKGFIEVEPPPEQPSLFGDGLAEAI